MDAQSILCLSRTNLKALIRKLTLLTFPFFSVPLKPSFTQISEVSTTIEVLMRRSNKRHKPPPVEALTSSNDLPEIIHEILLRLPAKSLLRFKSVCKSWNDVISDHMFIQCHHNLSLLASKYKKKVFCRLENTRVFPTLFSENHEPYVQRLCFPQQGRRTPRLLCSCDGFVLMIDDESPVFFLWNPSIRRYTKFTCPYDNFPSEYAACGLYHNSLTDDYNVLAIFRDSYFVYSLKSFRWVEKLQGFPYSGSRVMSSSVFANGALYWAMSQQREANGVLELHGRSAEDDYVCDVSRSHEVLCFDPKREKFSTVPRPEPVCDDCEFDLTVLEGCLGLYCYDTNRNSMKIWLRTGQDYNDPSSWAKSIVISDVADPYGGSTRVCGQVGLLCFIEESEMLLYIKGSGFVLYNVKKEKFRGADAKLYAGFKGFGTAVTYVDSLLLPGVDDKPKRRWLQTEKREHTTSNRKTREKIMEPLEPLMD